MKNYSLMWMIEGSGVYRDEFSEFDFKVGDVLLRLPNRSHEIVYDASTTMKSYSAHLPMESWQMLGVEVAQPILKVKAPPAWNLQFLEIIKDASVALPADHFYIMSRLHLWVSQFFHLAQQNSGVQSEMIQRIKAKFALTGGQRPDVEQMAKEFHVSVSHLRRCFLRETGQSLHQFHIQCRLKEVQYLLSNSQMTVSEIAERCAYSNPFALSKQFKEHFGESPTAYRETVLLS